MRFIPQLSKFRIPYASDQLFGYMLLLTILGNLIFVNRFSDPVDVPRLGIWSLLAGLALITLAGRKILASSLPKPMLAALAAMWVWSLVSSIWSLDRINSLIGVQIRMTSSLWFFSIWVLTVWMLSDGALREFLL